MCTTTLPRGLQQLVRNRPKDIDDQAEGFIDFEQGLDWNFRMVGHEVKRQIVERLTQVG